MAIEPTGMIANITATIDTTPDSKSTLFDSTRAIGSISGDNTIEDGVDINGMHWSASGEDDRYKPLLTDYENNTLGDNLSSLSGKSLYIWDGESMIELEFDDAIRSTDSEITWNPDADTYDLRRIYLGSDSNPIFIEDSDKSAYIDTE